MVTMRKGSQSLSVDIFGGFGVGELKDISGSMAITQDNRQHSHELIHKL
ncbi:MAG: hypothetical protein ACI9C4_000657 [Paraglaciecola sp.]|jgi:hypothetical protein